MEDRLSLRQIRMMRGMTQEALADMLGVSRNTLMNWEQGKTEPLISQAVQLADALAFPIAYFKW